MQVLAFVLHSCEEDSFQQQSQILSDSGGTPATHPWVYVNYATLEKDTSYLFLAKVKVSVTNDYNRCAALLKKASLLCLVRRVRVGQYFDLAVGTNPVKLIEMIF